MFFMAHPKKKKQKKEQSSMKKILNWQLKNFPGLPTPSIYFSGALSNLLLSVLISNLGIIIQVQFAL